MRASHSHSLEALGYRPPAATHARATTSRRPRPSAVRRLLNQPRPPRYTPRPVRACRPSSSASPTPRAQPCGPLCPTAALARAATSRRPRPARCVACSTAAPTALYTTPCPSVSTKFERHAYPAGSAPRLPCPAATHARAVTSRRPRPARCAACSTAAPTALYATPGPSVSTKFKRLAYSAGSAPRLLCPAAALARAATSRRPRPARCAACSTSRAHRVIRHALSERVDQVQVPRLPRGLSLAAPLPAAAHARAATARRPRPTRGAARAMAAPSAIYYHAQPEHVTKIERLADPGLSPAAPLPRRDPTRHAPATCTRATPCRATQTP